jgi:CBS domain-containing protein
MQSVEIGRSGKHPARNHRLESRRNRVATVREIMTREVRTVEPETPLREALGLFVGAAVSGAPVVANGRLVGVVSVSDIIEFEATQPGVPTVQPEHSDWGDLEAPDVWVEGDDAPASFFLGYWSDAGAETTARFESPSAPEWDRLSEHLVSEVMTRSVVGLAPGASVRAAARLMVDADVQRLLVLEDGALLGIVTTTDVVRALADGKV